jgi:putative lipoic acid-binding regulatory protein
MITLDESMSKRPDIEYPLEWGFKIIGRDRDALERSIKEIMQDREYKCHIGNSSKGGKFHSYNASCQVETQEDRDKIFKYFQDHNDVKMVI